MLTAIIAVTLTVPDLAAIERAYSGYLGYEVIERGSLPAELASLWNAPALSDHQYMVMRPASGEPVYLRVIQQDRVEGHAAMKTWGWNSNEILVQDTYAIRDRLEGSPFEVIGEPKGLSVYPDIVAMQALGPAGELIYLTRIPEGKSLFNLGSAKSFVDRTFIVVLGGPDMEAMREFYASRLGMPVTPAGPSTITVLARAWGMAVDTQFPLAIVQFPKDFLVELDEYPDGATPRPVREGALPGGIAMVTFHAEGLERLDGDYFVPPRRVEAFPYNGRKAALLRGAAGELIELIED